WSALPLPLGLRWAGVALATAAIPLLVWVQRALGSNFYTTLHLRQEHTLVCDGPYRWVRHPMYTVFYLMFLSIFLITANGFLGLYFLATFTLLMFVRVPNEERVLVEKFGDGYRRYMQRTGRFLPRLVWSVPPGQEVVG